MVKERIDIVLTKKGFAQSRERAKILIMAGAVYVNGERITKTDTKVSEQANIQIKLNPIPYVSYGGVKLEKVLKECSIYLKGKKAIDIGSSTGGFVDCMLQHGVSYVYAIDVGTHQLHDKLRKDKRVKLMEGINARYLTFHDIGERVDIVTIDVSFISIKKILSVVKVFLDKGGLIISLIKPQFEVGRFEVGKGGIVKDEEKIKKVIEEITAFGECIGLKPINICEAPREKQKKNREFFIVWEI
ncbi:MAG TPA: TlyA family RNA methyltransferase [Syntrophorhabdaceae bacterium]|nr:TlyA family RNA methyltransferase [Syntrophorhabdaceae bacterium]